MVHDFQPWRSSQRALGSLPDQRDELRRGAGRECSRRRHDGSFPSQGNSTSRRRGRRPQHWGLGFTSFVIQGRWPIDRVFGSVDRVFGSIDRCGKGQSRSIWPGRLGFRVLRRGAWGEGSGGWQMGFLVPLSQISPVLVAIVLLVLPAVLWALSYIVEWTQRLDQGSGTTTPSFLEDPSSLEKVRCPSVFGPAEKYLSLVIPAFDEEARLPLTLDETLRYLEGRAAVDKSFTYEIIIVDDGSRDNTVKVAFDYIKKHSIDNVRLIKQGVNCGKGAAVTKGALCSRGELILMLDADGATKITNLEKLEAAIKRYGEKIQEQGAAAQSIAEIPIVACGSRAHLEQQALATRKWYRNFLMKGFHLCVLLAAGSGIRDTQCGFKMFTRSAAQQLFINLRLRRWCFDVELLYLCKRLEIPAMEIAVNWTEIPGSKLRMISVIHMLFELLLIRVGYGFNVWKIHQSLVQNI